MSDYKDAIVSFVSGGGFVALVRLVMFLVSRHREKDSAKALKDVKWLYEQLNLLKSRIGCECVWIGRTSNGGGIPRLGQNVYHYVPYIVSNGELPKSALTSVVHGQLATMLTRIVASRVSFMPIFMTYCDFISGLADLNVCNVMLFHTKITKRSVFYLGVGFSKENRRVLKADEQTQVLSACKQIALKLKD